MSAAHQRAASSIVSPTRRIAVETHLKDRPNTKFANDARPPSISRTTSTSAARFPSRASRTIAIRRTQIRSSSGPARDQETLITSLASVKNAASSRSQARRTSPKDDSIRARTGDHIHAGLPGPATHYPHATHPFIRTALFQLWCPCFSPSSCRLPSPLHLPFPLNCSSARRYPHTFCAGA